MAIAARVVGGQLDPTAITHLHVSAEGPGATQGHRRERATLGHIKGLTFSEGVAKTASDVPDAEGGGSHAGLQTIQVQASDSPQTAARKLAVDSASFLAAQRVVVGLCRKPPR